MAQYATEALIIGIKNWGEADKIITLLSPERGRIKAAAFGCRRPKSPLSGALQMFNHVEVQVREGEKLDTIRTCSLLESYRVMSTDFQAMAYGAFVAETASKLAVENFPQQEMYKRLLEIFPAFGERNPRIAALAAAYQLLEYSGMQMNYDYCAECNQELHEDAFFCFEAGGALCRKCGSIHRKKLGEIEVLNYTNEMRVFIGQLLRLDWQSKPAFSVSGKVLVSAERLLLRYLHHIFEKPLKSLEFIQQIG